MNYTILLYCMMIQNAVESLIGVLLSCMVKLQLFMSLKMDRADHFRG